LILINKRIPADRLTKGCEREKSAKLLIEDIFFAAPPMKKMFQGLREETSVKKESLNKY